MNNNALIPTLTNMLDEVFGSETLDHVARKNFWTPAANIQEFEDKFTIEVSSPGFSKEDFEINLEEQSLVISSKKEFINEENKGNYSRREFSFKNFTRKFNLPKNIDIESIEANYENGILTITLPKHEKAKIAKKIEIK